MNNKPTRRLQEGHRPGAGHVPLEKGYKPVPNPSKLNNPPPQQQQGGSGVPNPPADKK